MSPLSIGEAAREVWARTTLRVPDARYVLVSLPPEALAEAAALVGRCSVFAALLLERDEVSLTVAEPTWWGSPLRARAAGEAGPYRAITLDTNVDLSVTGYMAPAAVRLAAAGVSIVPQCAYLKDHLLVRETDLDTACRVLEELIAECRR
jgi:hypothetical protein